MNNRVKRQDGTWGPSYVDGKFLPYYDSKGNLTVGYGHLITDVNDARPFSDSEADSYFNKDHNTAKAGADKIMKDYGIVNAPGPVKDVLSEMTFQMGEGNVREFQGALNAAKLGDYDKMVEEMLD
jgi:GH24 family phage-related lysozyme (muramidase)